MFDICFDKEKEVLDLHQRTSEGIKTAKLNGKQIGRIKGQKYKRWLLINVQDVEEQKQ